MKLLTSESELEELSSDAGMVKLKPAAGCIASSEKDVVEALASAEAKGISVTARGGGTAIPTQSVGRGLVLLQEATGAVLAEDGDVTCGPAMVKAELNALLERSGRWMPVDPSSYRSCTVGGMVANNSSGVRTPKYHSTIDYVTSLRVVLPGDGPVEVRPMTTQSALESDPKARKVAGLLLDNQKSIEAERAPVTKNSSGYRLERVLHDGIVDLPKLFVGSEGTLGITTEAVLKTSPRPESRVLLIVEAALGELGAMVQAFRELGPTSVELVDKSIFRKLGREDKIATYSRSEGDYLVFCELDGPERAMSPKIEDVAGSKAGQYDPLVLLGGTEIAQAWDLRNETLALAQEMREGGRVVVPGIEDLVVPPGRLTDLVRLLRDQLEGRGLSYISYGHAADANLHTRPLLDPASSSDMRVLDELMEECFEAVWRIGGSMTGEHGDGMLRARFVERQYPMTYHLMKEIKNTFDPKGMLNPGVKIA